MNDNSIKETRTSVNAKIPHIAYTDINREEFERDTVLHGSIKIDQTKDKLTFKESNISGNINEIDINSATEENAGAMSADDKLNLNNSTVIQVNWTNRSSLNDELFLKYGVYNIKGERNPEIDDNLPILNTGGGHSFNARLTVLDSSISGSGKDDDKCITQVLSFSNRLGQGEVYIRTGKGASLNSLSWEKWSVLQRNVNVEEVGSLDDLKDNGIYSGVWLFGSLNNYPLTFVCVVINDYFIGTAPRRISQFVYGLSKFDGSVVYQSRVWDDSKDEWSEWEILNQKEIKSLVDNAIKSVIADAPEAFDTLREIADWIANDETGAVALANAISANAAAITAERTRAIGQEGLLNNAIVEEKGRAEQTEQAIEDKIDEEIDRSVAADQDLLRRIEEEVKRANEAENELANAITEEAKATDEKIAKEKTALVNGDTIVGQAREIHSRNGKTVTDSFLSRTTAGSGTIGDGVASLKSLGGNILKTLVDGTFGSGTIPVVSGHTYYASAIARNEGILFNGKTATAGNEWSLLSIREKVTSSECVVSLTENKSLVIDLTEIFGAGTEPTKEECDKLFGIMDALPQGLSIANPTELKSTGYNQADPSKVLANKGIENGAIVDKVGSNIAVVPCLPCKVGTGENNGYCIHGAFDEGAEKVYLTPLNPREVEGELYMCELTKDADKGTYVPQIKGYMLVEVPNATNLCVHFLWSEDKGRHDFEPYYESKAELPDIPEMSEWGLAGIKANGVLVQDEIDFERGVYVKRIGAVDMDSLNWVSHGSYNIYRAMVPGLRRAENAPMRITGILTNKYSVDTVAAVNDTFTNKTFKRLTNNIYVRDTTYTDVTSFKTSIQGEILYYELAEPIEYPLPKVENNYISSDYGVEQFNSVVPCNANNLYYMRSLAGETRNFLDKLYKETDSIDANAAVDGLMNRKVLLDRKISSGIAFWGSSSTESDWVKSVAANLNMPYYWGGSGGEKIWAIMGRMGVLPLRIKTPFTIPASSQEPVNLPDNYNFYVKWKGTYKGASIWGSKSVPSYKLLVNPCYIAGVKGNLIGGGVNSDIPLQFQRLEDGNAVTTKAYEPVFTYGFRETRDCVQFLACHFNGGESSTEELVELYKKMYEVSCNKRVLILGRHKVANGVVTSPTLEMLQEQEIALENEFGLMFFNTREYMCGRGFERFKELYPTYYTSADIEQAAQGITPDCMYVSAANVHLNSKGYVVLIEAVTQRLIELGYNLFRLGGDMEHHIY